MLTQIDRECPNIESSSLKPRVSLRNKEGDATFKKKKKKKKSKTELKEYYAGKLRRIMVHKYFPGVSMDANVVVVDYNSVKILHICFIFSPDFTSTF